MQHPDEGMIHTWLDGELPAAEAAALEAHVAECDQCRASVAEARGFIAASSRIVGTLDNVPGGVIPIAKPVKRVWYSTPQFRAAAAVLIVAGASFLVTRPGMQKSTLAVPGSAVMADAATAERIMSAASPAVAAAPPVVQPPVAANQALSKKEAAKSVTAAPPPPKGLAVLGAPVREMDAARSSPPAPKVASEDYFSGKGVKGGAANGVAGGVAVTRDTVALSGRVAGVAMKAVDAVRPRSALAPIESELKLIRVDSTATIKKTTYELASGKEVVLTEQGPSLEDATVTGISERRKQVEAAPSLPPVVVNAPVASAAVAQRVSDVHTIRWIDSLTRRSFTLSGPVSAEELEGIKVRLLQPKR